MATTLPIRFFRSGMRPTAPLDEAEIAFDPDDFTPRIHTRLLVLQPTPFCNLDCDYCYLPERDKRAQMDFETVYLAARRLVEDGLLGSSLTVIWHAGEPLVLPTSYYETAFDALARALPDGYPVQHSFQTNATLIDDRWCEFFRLHDVQVGVSADGPAFIHDAHRRTRTARGTSRAVLKGLSALRRHQIDHHAIAVVTVDSVHLPDAVHAFFVSQEIRNVGLNFDEAEGVHAESSMAGHDDAYRAFLERMLDHMSADGASFQIRELAGAYEAISEQGRTFSWRGQVCPENVQTMPFALISVAWDGSFSTFSPELLGQRTAAQQSFLFGNVRDAGYLASARSAAFLSFWQAVRQGVEACRASCTYFNFCGGGSPVNKLYENGAVTSTETQYCRLMIQTPLEVMLSRLENAFAV